MASRTRCARPPTGAANLVAIAYPGPIAPAKANTAGALVLANATGAVGQLLAGNGKITYAGKTTAEIADEVLPALTATVATLRAKDPVELAEFRRAVTTAVNQAAVAIGPQSRPRRHDRQGHRRAGRRCLTPEPGRPGTSRRPRARTLTGRPSHSTRSST